MKYKKSNTYAEITKSSFVHSRIDENIKAQASFILGKIGLNVSDAIRLLLNQIVLRKGMPFPVCIPNAETIAAMESAAKGENLEEFTLKELRKQFQNERKKVESSKRK